MLISLTVLLSAFFTWLQIRVNSRLGLTAAPRADRWHSVPTPSSGGLAIFLSCAVAYVLVCPGRYPRVAIAAVALWIFGFVDDLLRLSPRLKIATQIAAASFVVLGGLVCHLTPSYPANAALSIFWIVLITNALNLVDNMDGLCAGVVIVICLFRFWFLNLAGYRTEAELCAIMAAAFAGFLIFNYHPARIFMGDCGSLPAGFALGALTLVGPNNHPGNVLAGFFYPAFTFAYPIFDTTLVSVLRKLAGRPISQGGRDHSSHRLVSRGFNQRQVVGIVWLLTAFGAGLAMMIQLMAHTWWLAGALLLSVFSALAFYLATAPGYPSPVRISGWMQRPSTPSSFRTAPVRPVE